MKRPIFSVLLAFLSFSAYTQTQDVRLWGGTSSTARWLNNGSIYSLNADGSDFQVVKKFEPNLDGGVPVGQILKLSDGTLMGTTSEGGAHDMGVIYKLNGDGTGYTKVFEFAPGLGFGSTGKLIQGNDGLVYGTARSWINGTPGAGTIFRINPDGTNYTVLHEMLDPLEGNIPWGGLLQASDDMLYGTAYAGGSSQGLGALYRLNIDGTGFQKIHTFEGTEGLRPTGYLVEGADGFLYGFAYNTLFKIQKNGAGYQVIHTSGLASVGGIMQLAGGKLIGIRNGTEDGNGGGALFTINPDGSDYTVVVEFPSYRWTGPIGLTSSGQVYVSRDDGIYLADTNGSNVTNISLPQYDYKGVYRNVLEVDDGVFIGMVDQAGTSQNGVIFKATLDGTVTQLKDFPQEGADIETSLMLASNGYLYGRTVRGGEYGFGALFRIKPNGTEYTRLRDFAESDRPLYAHFIPGDLLEADEKIYGTDLKGIYRTDLDGASFEYIHVTFFNPVNNLLELPCGSIIDVSDGYLYGITNSVNFSPGGMIYKIKPNGDDFQVVLNLASTEAAGPITITLVNDELYVHSKSVENDRIVSKLFKISLDGTNVVRLLESDLQANDIRPESRLLAASDGRIYGTTYAFNPFFSFNPDGSDFTQLPGILENGLVGTPIEPIPGTAYIASPFDFLYSCNIATGDLNILYASEDREFTSENIFRPYSSLLAYFKMDQTIELSFDLTYADSSPITLPEVSGELLPVTYSSSDLSVATVEGNMITIIGKGTTVITATQSGDMATKAVSIEKDLVVLGVPQTIGFSSLDEMKLGDPDFQLFAIASSELEIRYTSSDTDIANIDGNILHIVGVGTVTITAYQDGSSLYDEAVPVEQSLHVNKGSQLITFLPITNKTMGDEPFKGTASSSPLLPITYTPSSDKVSIDGDEITILKPGSVTIEASQPGDDSYEPAVPLEQTFCINPATPVVTVEPAEHAMLTSSNAEGNQWYFDDTIIGGATDQIYITTKPGSYTVITTVDNCVSESSIAMPVVVTGFGDTAGDKVFIYPNPVATQLLVEVGLSNNPVIIDITDVFGKTIHYRETERQSEDFDFTNAAPGMYIITVFIDGNEYPIRVMRR